jgi:lipopolysaccharide export system protein LptA
MQRIIRLFVLIGLLLAVGALAAAAEKHIGGRNRQPIQIKSDELNADNAKKTATFVGNVVARQGDLVLYADKLVVTYGEKGDALSRAEAFGNMRIVQGARRGQADHGVYDTVKGTIVMDGSPKVFQGDNTIAGSVITYYLDEDRSVVSGGPGVRVEAVIQPGEQGKNGRQAP